MHLRFRCIDLGDEIATFPYELKRKGNGSFSFEVNEDFNRTGESRWALTCGEAGHYGTITNSEGEHFLPIKCIPRGNLYEMCNQISSFNENVNDGNLQR